MCIFLELPSGAQRVKLGYKIGFHECECEITWLDDILWLKGAKVLNVTYHGSGLKCQVVAPRLASLENCANSCEAINVIKLAQAHASPK